MNHNEQSLPTETNPIKMIHHHHHHPRGPSLPIKQPNLHRSCLKHRSTLTEEHQDQTVRLSSYRVSFAHPNSNDGKMLLTPQSSNEKKHRSDMFMKKAKELQLAEITYFKDHARDKQPIDE